MVRLEFGRTLAASGGDTIVGSAGVFSFQMRVPGAGRGRLGELGCGASLAQGILSTLVRRQLADVSEWGEAVAVLFGSESGIYGRYGYGRASWHAAYRLQRGEGTLAPGAPADPGLRLRIAEPLSVRAELAQVYDLALAERPGLYARTEPWWDRLLTDLHSDGEPSRQIRGVLAEDDSGPRGYAVFTSTERWDDDANLPKVSWRSARRSPPTPQRLLRSGTTCLAATWSANSTPGCARCMTRRRSSNRSQLVTVM